MEELLVTSRQTHELLKGEKTHSIAKTAYYF